ncbi:DegV family protein [Roseburia sp. NSJ-9]|uniref:DegV family protein n=1 Tax=Roseburia lenta TaxID=2763061 RepID=A0ABR7GCB5_9FIRM|nr:DegV family protein [Roseburia lenta]MBC5685080.1 DegV family protein [Roseburia lenta]
MSKVAILTDSNSGITQEEAEQAGIYVFPTPVYINDEVFYEGVDLTTDQFFARQAEGAEIKTSMPVVGDVIDKWESLLEEYDEVVYIPLSSGLSSSCETAIMLAEDYDGKVQVVNNQRISVTMKLSVYDAKKLADAGKSATEIKEILEAMKFESTIYIMVDTLEYLKKGGRITPAAAAIGSLLKIKPVLQIRGEKLDSFAKARTVKQAKQIMMDAIAKDMDEVLHDPTGENTIIAMAHTQNEEEIAKFKAEVEERFPGHDIFVDPLSLVVSSHIGPGALAVTCTKKLTSF